MKIIILITTALLLHLVALSQWHISFSSGYNFPLQKNNTWAPYQNLTDINYYNIVYDTTGSYDLVLYKIDNSYKNEKIKFNTGFQYSIGVSYIFKKYFGFDLQYTYNNDSLSFSKNNFQKRFGNITILPDQSYGTYDINIYSHVLNSTTRRYQLGIIFQYPFKNNLVPYIKTSIGLNDTKIKIRSKPYSWSNMNIIEEYYSRLTRSYSFTLGLKRSYKNIDIFAEAVYNLYSYSPDKGKILNNDFEDPNIEFTNDNYLIDAFSKYPNYYIDSVFYSNKRIKPSFQLNTLSFNIGFQYKIPSSKDDVKWLKDNFISHLFFEFDKGYAWAIDKKTLPMPYANMTAECYVSKEPIYDPSWNSPNHLRYYIEKTVLKRKNNSMNFATGFITSASIGYNFNKYFAAIFNYKYNYTATDKHEKSTIAIEVIYDPNFGMDVPEYNASLSSLDSLKFDFTSKNNTYSFLGMFQYPFSDKITPFIKLGVGISTHIIQVNKMYKLYAYYSIGEVRLYPYKEKYYDSFSFPKQISLGAKFKIVNHLFLTSQAIFTFENYKPSKVFIYDKYEDGYNYQFDMDLTDDEYHANPLNTIYTPDPYNVLYRYKTTFSMSTVSFQLGLQYSIY